MNDFPKLFLPIFFLNLYLLLDIATILANEDAKRLYDDLLINYNRHRRPSVSPNKSVSIRLKLRLSQIIDVHEIDQIMTVSVWLKQVWMDPKLAWDPKNYGDVNVLYVPHEMIWVPDIVLYNNADSQYNITIGTKATLYHTGQVVWEPPAIFKSLCQMDVEFFPFDEQHCRLKFGSWSYSENLLDLRLWNEETILTTGRDTDEVVSVDHNGIDLSDYYPSVEWDVMSVVAHRSAQSYVGCCPGTGIYVDIIYNLVLRRKPLFYTVNLVFPCVGISFLTILVFYLPSDSGEKIALCISILVALTVFFLLLTEIIPATSIVLPLIGKYLLFTMCMVTLSVLITVLSLNFHFRKPTTHTLNEPIRTLFLRWLPKLLFMRRPFEPADSKKSRRLRQTKKAAGEWIQMNCRDSRITRDSGRTTVARPRVIDERIRRLYYSPGVVKAFENVCFIAELLKKKDRDNRVDQDWRYIASVLDRLFLVIFTLACFVGTAWILLQAPYFYDFRTPIDLKNLPLERAPKPDEL